ncbi:MAG: helicase, partial [Treponema sp.]|nr:helicase [Treponema sp.]
GGELSQKSETYEKRDSQIALLKQITRSFNKNLIGVFEAGTGVGKSFAYLIPALLWSLKNNEKVVISTGTINLQQQLFEKDIPMVEKIIGKKVSAVLMKGRQNYICLRRLYDVEGNRDFFDSDLQFFDKLSEWAKETTTGSKTELPFLPPSSVWSRMQSESEACMGAKCSYFSKCFVMKVRHLALNANVIVVNHHLLFADIEARMSGMGYTDIAVLPPYSRLIFDEAHGIEKDATSFFSLSVQRFSILRSLNLLYRKNKKRTQGFIGSLLIASGKGDMLPSFAKQVEKIKSLLSDLEKVCFEILEGSSMFRFTENTKRNVGVIVSLSDSLSKTIGNFLHNIKDVFKSIDDDEKQNGEFWESKISLRSLENAEKVFKDFSLWNEKPDYVFWLQKKTLFNASEEDSFIVFNETPIDISSLMYAGVFEPMKTVVLTSATLKNASSFSYLANRCGLSYVEEERLLFDEFASPFPYKKKVLFAVPKDAPVVENTIEFQSFVNNSLVKLIRATSGRTLVLFTSYEMLNSTYGDVKNFLKPFAVFKQGDEDANVLLEKFKSDEESVLFATDSFWQGVDVPGESLIQVVIVKLPFPVPSDPVFSARSDAVIKKGGSSFMELSVPEAIIKFRQGFGRLMRKTSDYGVVVVLDKRICEKSYGRFFLQSIPETKQIYGTLSEIEEKIGRFLDSI